MTWNLKARGEVGGILFRSDSVEPWKKNDFKIHIVRHAILGLVFFSIQLRMSKGITTEAAAKPLPKIHARRSIASCKFLYPPNLSWRLQGTSSKRRRNSSKNRRKSDRDFRRFHMSIAAFKELAYLVSQKSNMVLECLVKQRFRSKCQIFQVGFGRSNVSP